MKPQYKNLESLLDHLENMRLGSNESLNPAHAIYTLAREIKSIKDYIEYHKIKTQPLVCFGNGQYIEGETKTHEITLHNNPS